MRYFAHAHQTDSGVRQEQTVEEHCHHSAVYASWAAPPGLGQTAYLAALLHDMGKFTVAFSQYLLRAVAGEQVQRGSVNHTFAGVRFVWKQWHEAPKSPYHALTAEVIAFAIGAHHGQFDVLSPDGIDGFQHRLTAEGVDFEEAQTGFLTHCADLSTLDALFEEAVAEVTAILTRCGAPLAQTQEEQLFYLGLLSRLVLSAVIEGDRRDTAEFERTIAFAAAPLPPPPWAEKLQEVEVRLATLPTESEINRVRHHISERCREAAERGGGIYRLTVPTGGGKTLAALRYALAAAAHEKKQRLFFVIPLLSVLDQNAAVIRDYLADDEWVLEHHSNLVQESTDPQDEAASHEALRENWQAPVVITTLVQLLDTLFAGKTSCIRRMAALRNSVIVLDEVQSVPRRMLAPFNLALNFLKEICGATIVLCSATQPCLEKVTHRLRYSEDPELVPYDPLLWDTFRRTEIVDRRQPAGYSPEELASFAIACAEEQGSLLLIGNTKAEARALFNALRGGWNGKLFHLSTAMCMAHRLATLQAIRTALDTGERVICVSTQLVEAGVDISFGCVIRVSAGMENVIQAAGRCNRSGEFGRRCPVYIVNIRGENLHRLPDILQSQQAAESLLRHFSRAPEAFGHDLTGEQAIRTYYQTLYTEMKAGEQEYPLPQHGTTLFDLLSYNAHSRARCPHGTKPPYLIGQAFRTAGEAFHVFEDNTRDVLVPYGDGEELILALGENWAQWDTPHRIALLRQAGHFSVALYDHEWRWLQERGGLQTCCDGLVLVLRPEFYSADTGFSLEETETLFLEV